MAILDGVVTIRVPAAPLLMMEASELPVVGTSSLTALPDKQAESLRHQQASELDELFRRHEHELGQFLAAMIGDRWLADDVMQETFLTATREQARLATIENPQAWLFAIARRRALHALRSRRRGWNALQRLRPERHTEAPDPIEAIAVRDYLVRHLRPDERALLLLRYLHGFKAPELSAILGRSSDAVRQELSRTRRKLIEQFGDDPPNMG
jgi:RNA polymerase sigma-70 factor (ECF subfamily)